MFPSTWETRKEHKNHKSKGWKLKLKNHKMMRKQNKKRLLMNHTKLSWELFMACQASTKPHHHSLNLAHHHHHLVCESLLEPLVIVRKCSHQSRWCLQSSHNLEVVSHSTTRLHTKVSKVTQLQQVSLSEAKLVHESDANYLSAESWSVACSKGIQPQIYHQRSHFCFTRCVDQVLLRQQSLIFITCRLLVFEISVASNPITCQSAEITWISTRLFVFRGGLTLEIYSCDHLCQLL